MGSTTLRTGAGSSRSMLWLWCAGAAQSIARSPILKNNRQGPCEDVALLADANDGEPPDGGQVGSQVELLLLRVTKRQSELPAHSVLFSYPQPVAELCNLSTNVRCMWNSKVYFVTVLEHVPENIVRPRGIDDKQPNNTAMVSGKRNCLSRRGACAAPRSRLPGRSLRQQSSPLPTFVAVCLASTSSSSLVLVF